MRPILDTPQHSSARWSTLDATRVMRLHRDPRRKALWLYQEDPACFQMRRCHLSHPDRLRFESTPREKTCFSTSMKHLTCFPISATRSAKAHRLANFSGPDYRPQSQHRILWFFQEPLPGESM